MGFQGFPGIQSGLIDVILLLFVLLFSVHFLTIVLTLGSLEEQEFFGEVLLGIKQVIQTHMKEIQVKFQDKFFNLELEVKKRDDIISKLQNRIQELEHQDPLLVQEGGVQAVQTQQKAGSSGSGTSRSSDELPFMVSAVVDQPV